MCKQRLFFILIASLLLVVTAAQSGERGEVRFQVVPSARTDCQVGNLNNPVPPPVPDIFQGLQEYAYFIYPPDQCSCPDNGFMIENVNMWLHFDPNMIPVSFVVRGGLREAVWDPAADCYVPGDVICMSDETVYQIDDPGEYLITVETPQCPCVIFNERYFLVMEYLDAFPANLVIDDDPQPCIEYLYEGGVWQDMFGMKAAGGKTIVWSDIVCCDPGTDSAPSTWGSIKSLYR